MKDKKLSIVECKCYALEHKVGRPMLQKLVGANSSKKANSMVFITTSSFSAPAIAYGEEQGIWMIDGTELLNLLSKDMESDTAKNYLDPQSWWVTRDDLLAHIPADILF